MFGGSAADDTVEGNWKVYCNDKVFSDGVAVVFFLYRQRNSNILYRSIS